MNALRLSATLREQHALRHTPAGIPVVQCTLAHQSRQMEAGQEREVSVELAAIALGEIAQLLAAAPLGTGLRVEGFLAAQSLRNRRPVLHLTHIEFIETQGMTS